LKLGIVGPSESKWPLELIPSAIQEIYQIFLENWSWNPMASEPDKESQITLVSGGCHLGGVDIWAEIVADDLGTIKKEIYKADIHQWHDKRIMTPSGYYGQRLPVCTGIMNGYKSRNIKIAKAIDMLYCVVPYKPQATCKHCNEEGHPSNGGCWTMQYAKKLGKHTELDIIFPQMLTPWKINERNYW